MSQDNGPVDHLFETNQHWHDVLDIRYRQFLECITALNISEARGHFKLFRKLLTTHLKFEDEILIKQTSGEEATNRLIAADHAILTRVLVNVESSINCLEQSDQQRSVLIDHLNEFIRLKNILEHHDEREQQQFYPQLSNVISEQDNLDLSNAMDLAMRQADSQLQ